MKTLKLFLDHKGWLTTILGMILGLPTVAHGLYQYFAYGYLIYEELVTFSVFMAIAFFAVILPSKVEITTKFGGLKIED